MARNSTYFLATPADRLPPVQMQRFQPRYWLVNFPRPTIASVVTTGPSSLKVNCCFYDTQGLVGLIWETEDKEDHVLACYGTDENYSGNILTFRWKSSNVIPLDQPQGPTLTIEGRDASNNFRVWYVRLWNYAEGTPEDAVITLDFDNLYGGYNLPADEDRVDPTKIDRLFISIIPPQYNPSISEIFGGGIVNSVVEVTEISCSGPTIPLYEGVALTHSNRIATGYDDVYNTSPERLIKSIKDLGYREVINHYVGMSHYYDLVPYNEGTELKVKREGFPLNEACRQWHLDFFRRAREEGFYVISSLSFEVFNEVVYEEWKQRDWYGNSAATGWEPPSTLLSPCNDVAMDYLKDVAISFCSLLVEAEQPTHFQIGEPWWWVHYSTLIPYFYDNITKEMYFRETGRTAPQITQMEGSKTPEEKLFLEWLGVKLGESTEYIKNAVKWQYPKTTTYLLFFAPQVLATNTPDLHLVNRPEVWNSPCFDVLQLEDYDFVILGEVEKSAEAAKIVTEQMGYPVSRQHYFSGFVLLAENANTLWPLIFNAAQVGSQRGVNEVFYWASSQIFRDGFTIRHVAEPSLKTWWFTLDAHDMFVLRLGSEFKTLVYDLSTGTWSWWASNADQSLRASTGLNWDSSGPIAQQYGSTVIVGDDEEGILWVLDPDKPDDDSVLVDGDPIPFVREATGHASTRSRRFFPVYDIDLSCNLGDAGAPFKEVELLYSNDQGRTYIVANAPSTYEVGNYQQEFSWRSQGLIRSPGRLFKIRDRGAIQRIDSLDINGDINSE